MAAFGKLVVAIFAMETSTFAVVTFQLQSEDLSVFFNSVTLGSHNEIIEQKVITQNGVEVVIKIPGRLVWENVVLTRPAGESNALWVWRALVEEGDLTGATRDFSIVAFGEQGQELARWDFLSGWPVSLSFGINEAGEAVETLLIAFEQFSRAQFNVPSNKAPVINLPESFNLAVGDTAQFSVSTSDPDNDLVILANILSPEGADFTDGLFTWTAPVSAIETSETITFQADDQQNADNSVVTESLTITIPRDFDLDSMDDDWELVWFGSITNTGDSDLDDDGVSNADEFRAATSPIDPDSRFFVTAISNESGTVQITFTTEPGMLYQLQANDNAPEGPGWVSLGPAWTEEGTESSTKTMVDDSPPGTSRFYRILTRRP
jgi:phage tail-like protein